MEHNTTQSDRDAAAACARYFDHTLTADEILSGRADICNLVAIVRTHRIAARTAALEEVAAMIDGSDGMIPHSTVFVPVITGSNQPCMSGDGRDQLNPHRRRQFDDAAKTLANAIRQIPHHKEG